MAAPSAAETAAPARTAAPGVTRTPLSMMRKTIARRLVQARQEAAHLTTFNDVDMTELIRIRKAYGEDFQAKYKAKLGFMSFFVKAAIEALKEYPVINSRIEGDELVTPDFYDIGVAVSTDRGLLVPVLRNADRMNFGEIESALADLAARARDKRIELAELQGGTFTITNGGRLRLDALDADPELSAIRHPRHARHPAQARRLRRSGSRPQHDVPRRDVRPQAHRREGRGALPRQAQGMHGIPG